MRVLGQSVLLVGCAVCLAALGLRLDIESERMFVRSVEEGQLDGINVYEALERFGLIYESAKGSHFLSLRRNRCLYPLWRMLGQDEYIAVFVEARGDVVEGVYSVIGFPSTTPLYPRH